MVEVQSDHHLQSFPQPGHPQWMVRDTGWVLTAIGTVAAILLLLFPQVTQNHFRFRLIALVIILAAVAFLAVAIYCIRRVVCLYRKSASYDDLYAHLLSTQSELEQARDTIRQYITANDPYELESVLLHRDQLFVVIRKKPGRAMPIGTRFAVVDTGNGSPMGVFAVTEIRKAAYHAQADGFVNPIWIGFIKQSGKSEYSPPPGTAAFVMPTEESRND
jgi:hypothetical protein